MKGLKLSLLASAALFTAISVAKADVVSGGSVGLSSTATDYNRTLGNLSFFDSSLGTLNAVTFTYSFGFTSVITVAATTAASGDVATISAARFRSTNTAVSNVLNAVVNTVRPANVGSQTLTSAAFRVTGDESMYDVDPGASESFESNYALETKVRSTSDAAYLSALAVVGGGTFDVLARTLTGTTGTTTGGNASITQATSATQNISIDYVYTPNVAVPEPASLALLGAGLFGMGMFRRKSA